MHPALRHSLFLLTVSCTAALAAPGGTGFAELGGEFDRDILPLLEQHCLDCHDTATSKGELDLERFANLAAVRSDPKTWQDVIYQLETGEMPPTKKNRKQPTVEERAALMAWTRRYLDSEARAQAGDPGPVVLRRLSNAEFTYTIRDLTEVDSLDPIREFPVDSAAGEGFTNAGGALVMSPGLFEKYLEAGKQIADHAVLLPGGFRFSASTTQADHANEVLARIRRLYLDKTGGKEINFNYTSQVRSAEPEGEGEGRLNLTPYFAALLKHRERLRTDLAAAPRIAAEEGLNAPYFRALATMLVTGNPGGSFLLDHLRERWRTANPDQGAALAAEVRGWQNQLWAFEKVGHLGLVRPWQQPRSSLATVSDHRVKIDANTRSIVLSAHSFGSGAAKVEWQNPRIERPGRPPVLIQDLEAGLAEVQALRKGALAATTKYLAAASEIRRLGKAADPRAIATAQRLDLPVLNAWAAYLGLDHAGAVAKLEYLTQQLPRGGAYDFVKGWTLPGVADFSLLGNSSDQNVRIPGEMNAHQVVVHPRPERWIAAGWMSPLEGRVKLAPRVRDAHNNCGNGVAWALELRRGSLTRVLQSGNVDLGKAADAKVIEEFEVRKGDLLSLIIGARDNNHSCDLTEIDLAVTELDGATRQWSLAADCADSILAGNPHPDKYGNLAVWHFHGGMNEQRKVTPGVVPGSLLDQWLHEKDDARRRDLAARVQALLTHPLPPDAAEPDRSVHRQLTSLDGPLFSQLDLSELAKRSPSPESGPAAAGDRNRVVTPPTQLEFPVPGALLAGADFVVRGVVHPASDPHAIVQMSVGIGQPGAPESLLPGQPVVIRDDANARKKLEKAFSDFRDLFPAAMCYARVVPADEVVTLLLYHREDGHLVRLMLTDDEKLLLDRLWDELTFVSREPLRLVTAYEQIWQFATQDADPKRFEPMEATIRKRAADFAKILAAAEPAHLAAVLAFAPKVVRRPLAASEEAKLRSLYQRLREEDLPHEEAFRLTLARLFASPTFLYKGETPVAGKTQGPVSSRELATRLSYFLTSSTPDADLTAAAADRTLTTPQALRAHTRRLLTGDRTRRLAIHFACQWLHIRDFDQLDEKNERLFPEFANLRGSMYEESVRFFTDFFQNDRSVLSLLDADHTFVDAPLAKFYNLPAAGDGWRRIDGTRKAGRGGILALATTLASQSGASRTSPILRGTWVSETLLGEKLPKPPKDVPQLPDLVPDGLTERELIARHTSDPACAKCHARIDPYGFALENFDTIGRFRPHADTSATLPDGTAIEGLDGLRGYLLEARRETFLRNFCKKLLGYALGRAVQLSDEPLLDEILTKLAANDYRIGVAIEAIVLSPQFREIRGAAHR